MNSFAVAYDLVTGCSETQQWSLNHVMDGTFLDELSCCHFPNKCSAPHSVCKKYGNK